MPDTERLPLLVTAEERDALAKWLRQGQNIRGTGVRVSPDGIQINIVGGGSEGSGAKKTQQAIGQYQGMDCTMRTNNTLGFDFDQFVPPLNE